MGITINRLFLLLLFLCVFSCSSSKKEQNQKVTQHPNIVIIYVDDLGYADVGSYGAKGVETPNVDRLANDGLKFTDAHSAAATCTPSRYSLLTGEYAFRANAGILPGDAPMLISPGTPTLPGMLQKAGYKTAVVGKWHLGLGDGEVDWNQEVKPGPLEIGFDYSFLIPATGDRVPAVYLENHHVVNSQPDDPIRVSYSRKIGDRPTGTTHPELLRMGADLQHSGTIINGVSRIGYMAGGEEAEWKDEDFPDLLTQKAKAFMKQNKGEPFFLYFSFQDIHVPRLPHPRFVGKSEMGPRGDAIAQMDWVTGELVKSLEELGIAENTLVLFTSDNGPVLDDGYDDQAVELLGDHQPGGPFRGGKYSAYEAGTRVPTIAYWPGVIKPGESKALLSQVDLYASLAKLTGQNPKTHEGPDSEEVLSAWLGKSEQGRKVMLEEAFVFGIRNGDWKYIEPANEEQLKENEWIIGIKNMEGGVQEEAQLFNLATDRGEQTNLTSQYPEKVKEMQTLLDAIKKR